MDTSHSFDNDASAVFVERTTLLSLVGLHYRRHVLLLPSVE